MFSKFKVNRSPVKTYVAIRLGERIVSGAIWTIDNAKAVLGGVATETISGPTIEDNVTAADKVISGLSGGSKFSPSEVLYGVPPSWVVDGKVIEDRLATLRKIAKELSLTPLGFVTLPEVIVSFHQKLEGVPLTAILVGIEGQTVIVSVVRGGRIARSETLSFQSESEVNIKIEEALSSFEETEVLPSRFVVYDDNQSQQELKNQITSYPWTQKLPFLHFPKVELLPPEKVVEAVAICGSEQLGGVIEIEKGPELPGGEASSEVSLPQGFVREEEGEEKKLPEKKPQIQIRAGLNKISAFLSQVRPPSITRSWVYLAGGVLGLVVLVGLVVGGLYFTSKARITVFVEQKNVEFPQKDVLVITDGEIKQGEAKLLGSTMEIEESGSKRGASTGKRLVGEKAKGTVTVVGSLTISRTFPAQTVISAKGLKFYTDKAIEVASAAGIASPAQTTVTVTASGIGESFNLESGTLFSVEGYPATSYQAKNDSAFSGGSSRQVTVVSKDDQDRLLASLSAELTKKAFSDLSDKLQSGQTLLEGAVTTVVDKKRYDRDVDTESESFSLTMSTKHVGVLFSQADLAELIRKMFSADIPSGYGLEESMSSFTIVSTKKQKEGVFVSVKYDATLLPVLDKGTVAKNLPGKRPREARGYLSSLNGVVDSELKYTPSFSSYVWEVIGLPRNVSVEVVSR